MKALLTVLIGVCFIMTGCSSTGTKNVEVYTFKKERVDQAETGNKGYLLGDAPASTRTGSSKRTLIGVDIELPGSFTGSSKSSSAESQASVPAKAAATSAERVERTESADVYIK